MVSEDYFNGMVDLLALFRELAKKRLVLDEIMGEYPSQAVFCADCVHRKCGRFDDGGRKVMTIAGRCEVYDIPAASSVIRVCESFKLRTL